MENVGIVVVVCIFCELHCLREGGEADCVFDGFYDGRDSPVGVVNALYTFERAVECAVFLVGIDAFGQALEVSGFTALAWGVDGEIVSGRNDLVYSEKAGRVVDHVMLLFVTGACHVKLSHGVYFMFVREFPGDVRELIDC